LESQAHGGRGKDEVVGIGPDLIALSGELVHLGSDEGGEVRQDAAFPGSVAYGVRPTMQLRVAVERIKDVNVATIKSSTREFRAPDRVAGLAQQGFAGREIKSSLRR
jgi:hypothetical protein